ncbi:39S ribosomal protein L43, mitochondrial [Lingula anatina]|uniref:Large ribosomal subunit protein mL43 n=1 Tax=Lingula anatina TaxID=7574 RepID=A0A1S3KCZ3_LINAN|nr:39S ribosomal protein L43, mitochondrial [Lingula anatina]|eukprot:XP_013420498.1 39S ribosomal protein L43, mitochondrial [Lingula anatina]
MAGRIPSGFIKSALHNGVGRYVNQCQRITLKFCKEHGDSRGMRDFIEQELLDFTRSNPGVVMYLQPRRHRKPVIVAEYLNGYKENLYVPNYPKDEICKWVEHLRCKQGMTPMRLRKYQHTDNPSIQGIWNPFTNKDPSANVTTYPNPNVRVSAPESATDRLLKLAQELREKDN